jgi:hypothetical protein
MDNYTPQILPKDFTEAYYDQLQEFREREFGADVVIPLEKTRTYQAAGVNFYRAYGIFTPDKVEIKSLVQAYLINNDEYRLLREGKRDERELKAWQQTDGDAVLWVASAVSNITGGVTKVIEAIIRDIETHPHLSSIKTIAAFVTGAKGYMFAEACGMKRRPELYSGDMPFFDCPFTPAVLANAGEFLSRTWNISEIKVSIEKLRELTNGMARLSDMDARFALNE